MRLRRRAAWLLLALGAAAVLASFLALGTWQLQRRHWKLALITRVEQRVHAPATPAPGPEFWPSISAETDEYRHVSVSGIWLHQRRTWVQAATELGSGYWLLTPLRRPDGQIVLINRGFVPAERRAALDAQLAQGRPNAAPTTVTGLLRLSEPGGAFLRHNDPHANRWYSRDVQAIAAARELPGVAPYFIDADAAAAGSAPPGDGALAPVGGLTVVAFHNNHLAYAATWYALALMVAWASWRVMREERQRRRGGRAPHRNGDNEDARQD